MAMFNSAQSSCDFLLHSVRNSGLDFSCQETPFSIFLTLRKSFVKSKYLPNQASPSDVKEEKLIGENKSFNDAFNRLKNDYEDALAELESRAQETQELNKRIETLSGKYSVGQVLIKDLDNKLKDATNEKKKIETKYYQVDKENKTMKKEITQLNEQVKSSKNELKTAIKDKRDTNHNLEKKIVGLENKNKTLLEFKVLKDDEEKELKTKLKSVNKRLKSVTEREAKLSVDQSNHKKWKEQEKAEVEEKIIQTDLEDDTKTTSSTYLDTSCYNADIARSNISTSFYIADMTTYPSMVTHWVANSPLIDLKDEARHLMMMKNMNKMLKTFLLTFGRTSENYRNES